MPQSNQTADPYAEIATPVPAASSASTTPAPPTTDADPYAEIATPVASAGTSDLSTAGGQQKANLDFGKGVAEGAITSAGETIQSLPWIGKKIISPEAMQAERAYFAPGTAAEKYGQTTGNIAEPVLEFVLGDEALKGVSLADKLGIADKIAKISQDSPYIGKLLQHGVNAARIGTVGTAEALAKGATPREAMKTGAEVGLGGEAVNAAVEGAPAAVRSIRTNPFIKTALATPEAMGEAAAQPIAQAGVRAAAPSVGASFRSGIDVDTPFKVAKGLYRTVDEAANTNFQDLYTKLDNAKEAARQAPVGSAEEAKAELDVTNTQNHINDMKAVAAKSGVPDVDKTLAAADAKFTEAQADKDFNSRFFGSQSVVSGNIAHGVPETINVDAAIKTLENFDKPNRYGVSRLQQTSLGKDGAFKLKQFLYNAQRAGQEAINARVLRNTMLKWGIPGITGALGLGYELTK